MLIQVFSILLLRLLLKMLLATVLMAASASLAGGAVEGALSGKAGELLTLGVSACAGVAVYFAAAAVFRLEEAQLCVRLIKQFTKRGQT